MFWIDGAASVALPMQRIHGARLPGPLGIAIEAEREEVAGVVMADALVLRVAKMKIEKLEQRGDSASVISGHATARLQPEQHTTCALR